jgi:hypothetical protein
MISMSSEGSSTRACFLDRCMCCMASKNLRRIVLFSGRKSTSESQCMPVSCERLLPIVC